MPDLAANRTMAKFVGCQVLLVFLYNFDRVKTTDTRTGSSGWLGA